MSDRKAIPLLLLAAALIAAFAVWAWLQLDARWVG